MTAEAMSKAMSWDDHDILHRLYPYHFEWSAVYGRTFLYWFGSKPRLAIADPGMIKDVLMNTDGSFVKNELSPPIKMFFGQGILALEGERWSLHRRIANHAFKMEIVKVILLNINTKIH